MDWKLVLQIAGMVMIALVLVLVLRKPRKNEATGKYKLATVLTLSGLAALAMGIGLPALLGGC